MKYIKILAILGMAIVLPLLVVAIPVTSVLAASITVTPTKGPPGTTVTVIGEGFLAGEVIEVDFPPYEYRAYVSASSTGTFTTFFVIPEKPPGTYKVQAWRTEGTPTLAAQKDFTVTSRSQITLNPITGTVGTKIEISGTGYDTVENIAVKYDGSAVNIQSGDYRTDSNGNFRNALIMVPSSIAGYHTITVTGVNSNFQATADFTVEPVVTTNPTSGSPATPVTVTGNGFSYQKTVTVYFNNARVADETTTRDGSFTTTFTLPQIASGSYEIKAQDADNKLATTRFTISASISLNPTSGNIGSNATITGKGFKANSAITINYDNTPLTSATADSNGAFSLTFSIPSSTKGSHAITATDGTNSASAPFTVLTSASLNLASGFVGTKLTITGTGFTGTVTIKYDDKEVATTTADGNGAFSAPFTVPVSTHGEHIITATAGITTVKLTFTVESTPPPVPSLLLPINDSKAEPEAQFDWSDVTDPSPPVTYTLQIATNKDFTSPVLEKKGITISEYILTKEEKLKSVKKETPYYWRVKAIDSAANDSAWTTPQSFYVSPTFALPPWAIYTLIGIGVLAIGVLGFWLGRKSAYY